MQSTRLGMIEEHVKITEPIERSIDRLISQRFFLLLSWQRKTVFFKNSTLSATNIRRFQQKGGYWSRVQVQVELKSVK